VKVLAPEKRAAPIIAWDFHERTIRGSPVLERPFQPEVIAGKKTVAEKRKVVCDGDVQRDENPEVRGAARVYLGFSYLYRKKIRIILQ